MADVENVVNGLLDIGSFIAGRLVYGQARSYFKTIDDAIVLLKEQEPIRCKDCAYALFKEGAVLPGHIVCTKPYTERWQAVKPNNWFCADGERR